MATGMVLVIVMRQHRPVGRLDARASSPSPRRVMQVYQLGPWLGVGHPSIWIIARRSPCWRLALLIGAFNGYADRLCQHPGLHRHARRPHRLQRRRVGAVTSGETVAPMDKTFKLIGGDGPRASIGAVLELDAGGHRLRASSSSASVNGRTQRKRFKFPLRPVWAEMLLAAAAAARSSASTAVVNVLPLAVQGHRALCSRQRHPIPPAWRPATATRSAWRPKGRPLRRGPGLLHRLRDPGADRAGGRLVDDLHRHAHALRPLRLRHRRQSGGGRTRRHQHQLADRQGVHADGHSGRRSRRSSPRRASTPRPTRSAGSTNSTSSPPRSSAARRWPAVSAPSMAPCSARC